MMDAEKTLESVRRPVGSHMPYMAAAGGGDQHISWEGGRALCGPSDKQPESSHSSKRNVLYKEGILHSLLFGQFPGPLSVR